MSTTNDKWIAILAPDQPWQKAYAQTADVVRTYLQCHPGPFPLSTTALVAALFPSIEARGTAGIVARQRLFTALRALAKHELRDCVRSAEPKKNMYGVMAQASLWYAPKPKCAHCGGTGYEC